MYKNTALVLFAASLFAGCASVPMENSEANNKAKAFNTPSEGNAGLYIYRAGGPGASLKKDVRIDGKCIGETAPHMFFYEEVPGGKEYKISTESEFSPNDLLLRAESGENYFVRQYIKMGVFVGGANLERVSEQQGKAAIAQLDMAVKGTCSN